MRVDEPTEADVRYVARRMRAHELREFAAVSPYARIEDMLNALPDRFTPGGYGFYLGDRPVGIGTLSQSRENVATIGFFATDEFPKIALPLARFMRRRLLPAYVAQGFRRIDCYVAVDNPEGIRWTEMLGFEREGVLRSFGRNGEDFAVYAMVGEPERPVDFWARRTYAAPSSITADGERPHVLTPRTPGDRDVLVDERRR